MFLPNLQALILQSNCIRDKSKVLQASTQRDGVTMRPSKGVAAVVFSVCGKFTTEGVIFIHPHGGPSNRRPSVASLAVDGNSFELVLAISIVEEIYTNASCLSEGDQGGHSRDERGKHHGEKYVAMSL